jgi:hypothetical protein
MTDEVLESWLIQASSPRCSPSSIHPISQSRSASLRHPIPAFSDGTPNETTDPFLQKMLGFISQTTVYHATLGGLTNGLLDRLLQNLTANLLNPLWVKTCLGLLDASEPVSIVPIFLQNLANLEPLLFNVSDPNVVFLLFYFARCFARISSTEHFVNQINEFAVPFMRITTNIVPVIDVLPPFDVSAELLSDVVHIGSNAILPPQIWLDLFAAVFRAKDCRRLSAAAEFHALSALRKIVGELEPLSDEFSRSVVSVF